MRPHVGAIATSDTFYDPDPERHRRWAARGVLAVEMEAAVLFTIGGDPRCADGLHPHRLRPGRRERVVRIGDDALADGVARMTQLALAAAIDEKA